MIPGRCANKGKCRPRIRRDSGKNGDAGGAGRDRVDVGHLTWPEAVVIGGMQGVAELFPVSSLGHSILIPALVGGTWARDLDVSAPESPYLAFVVGLHVATALALIVFFRRDWARIVRGLLMGPPRFRSSGRVRDGAALNGELASSLTKPPRLRTSGTFARLLSRW